MSTARPERVIGLAVVIAVASFFVAFPIGADEIYSGEPISLELEGADLEAVLANFSEMTGIVFAVDAQTAGSGVLEQQIDALYEMTPWDRVLDEMLGSAGLAWTLEGQVMWIHLPGLVPDGDRHFAGEPINLRLRDADLRQVMTTFSEITQLTIDVDPEIEATVTVSLRQLPWDQALDLILRVNGLAYTNQNGLVRVYRRNSAAGKQILP